MTGAGPLVSWRKYSPIEKMQRCYTVCLQMCSCLTHTPAPIIGVYMSIWQVLVVVLIKLVTHKGGTGQPSVWRESAAGSEKAAPARAQCKMVNALTHNYWFRWSVVMDQTVFWAHVRCVRSTSIYLIHHVASIVQLLTNGCPAVVFFCFVFMSPECLYKQDKTMTK